MKKNILVFAKSNARFRLRGEGNVVMRGAWSKPNNTFGVCTCGGLTIHGQCQSCMTDVRCMYCGDAVMPDGSSRKQGSYTKQSHGMCLKCAVTNLEYKYLYPVLMRRIPALAESVMELIVKLRTS